MRITNKIMQNNSLTNLNRNKVYADQLTTQLSSKKKITRPSDDPIIAIRSLRLNTSITQLTQYYEKNVSDASSWLKATEEAVSTTISVVTDMYEQCTKGAEGVKTPSDREKILESLKQLRDEVYSTGNTDYAGRYLFSGYRTDTPLTFQGATKQQYTITEQLDTAAIGSYNYIDTGDLSSLTEANAQSGITTEEKDVVSYDVHRIQLAYSSCDKDGLPVISYYDETGTEQKIELTADDVVSVNSENPNPYTSAQSSATGVTFIPETGELILSDAVYNKLMAVKDDTATDDINEGEIRITYNKSEWNKNELRPEHYYACESEGVKYNEDFLTNATNDVDGQIISYDMGLNQTLRVNTNAKEVYVPGIGRDVDDLIRVTDDTIKMQNAVDTLDKMLEKDPENADLKERLNAANKALDYLSNKMQRMFESGLTKMQNHLDTANLALTQAGARGQRLDLIKNRLGSQQTTFKTLSSENEDVDFEEVAVQLSSAELSYQAALMATGKIAQTTLLNYL
ncbi:MAG: flagellar hook-associated protein FlgL [Lachnospiraceae bacterium]|nr:flagellar hook-associated protein FlgL [Lachnospiraceae bacterium]